MLEERLNFFSFLIKNYTIKLSLCEKSNKDYVAKNYTEKTLM